LLAEWLAETAGEDHLVAWLSLGPEDSDPASFWTGVLTALRTALPHQGSSALAFLDLTPLPTTQLVTSLVNELAETPGEVWLVLDDYHLVDGHDVRDAMTFLLEHLPPTVHVVLSTRSDPDLPLARWRARGELVEIRAADLRFTSDEAALYLEQATGVRLRPADVAMLEDRTEGWIAALQLAALSLRGRDDVSGFVARFAGDDRYIVDYLLEEVLRHEPEAVREFLWKTAFLDRLTGRLCDALTGRGDGGDQLLALDRANLFIVPLDDHRQWYRYHHLFADVLRARLLSEHPDQVPLLHARASRWYELHDQWQDAIRHALAGRDVDRAAHLMEQAVPAIRRHRQEALMRGWLSALPDDAIRRSPVLSVFAGSLLMVSGDLGAVEARLADAERAMAGGPDGEAAPWADTEELRTLPATIAIYRASLAQARGDAAGTATHARRALELAGPHHHLARGGAAGFLGLAAWADGDISTALATFAQAVASLHAAGNLVDELSGTVVLADMWLAAGRPGKARGLYQRALPLAYAQGDSVARATAELHVGLGELDVDSGDLDSAKRHLEIAATLAARAAMNESHFRWFVAMARVACAEENWPEAVRLLDRAEQLYRPGFFPDVRPIPAMRARIWVMQGQLSLADDWARERGVSVTDPARYLSEYDHLTLVRLVLAHHQSHPDPGGTADAVLLLARLLDAAERSGRAGSVVEIRMLQALADDAQAHRPLRPTPAHNADLKPAQSLTERERQVLRLLDSDLSVPEIARQLFVSHNTLRTHTKHIFTKLEVTTRRAAVSRARERGLM
ncbi:MAG: LuxR C-terminal-related transcriptional regulator, partial [Lapillicoccus sp.]